MRRNGRSTWSSGWLWGRPGGLLFLGGGEFAILLELASTGSRA